MPSSLSGRALLLALPLLLLAACAQPEKQTKGQPPLGGGETEAAPSSASPITEEEVDSDRAAAMEDCYRYATSQVNADRQIDSDIDSRYGRGGIGSDYGSFREQMRPYQYEQRRKQLFEDCLKQRGYSVER